jgi:hypothetical protein
MAFFQRLLEQLAVERQLGHQVLEASVLALEF